MANSSLIEKPIAVGTYQGVAITLGNDGEFRAATGETDMTLAGVKKKIANEQRRQAQSKVNAVTVCVFFRNHPSRGWDRDDDDVSPPDWRTVTYEEMNAHTEKVILRDGALVLDRYDTNAVVFFRQDDPMLGEIRHVVTRRKAAEKVVEALEAEEARLFEAHGFTFHSLYGREKLARVAEEEARLAAFATKKLPAKRKRAR